MAPGRIRVILAGSIHANRTTVRRFLEDDGYEVVGETPTRENLAAAMRRSEPDAVVVDQGLLSRGMMARLRHAAPDAKIIVFTDGPTTQASAPGGADGYLEKGVGLAALTALLVRLFTDEMALAQPVAAGLAGGGAAPDTGVAAATGVSGARASSVGAVARLATIAGGAVLIVWGLIAMIANTGVAPPPADTTDTTRPETVVASSALDGAYDALDGLTAALRDGNYVLATIQAQTLMDQRRQAIAEGFSLSGLDAAIAVTLDGLVNGLPQRVNTTLADIIRSLYPTLPDEDQPGGGSGVVIGPATVSGSSSSPDGDGSGGGGAGSGGGGSDGSGDGGGSGGGGGDGSGDGGGSGGGGGGSGGGGEQGTETDGNGNAWGHSKDKTQGRACGHAKDKCDKDEHPGGGPPPWAHGNGNGHENRAKHHKK